ncbi:hypothetical protein FA95DRAFT_1562590 [Auriscalpium vulgare]|uniref:Uncharacterized protein n=1 Tax=Auriscalpium vulgare TaxID=40419 RepID=A0ACB8RIM3_9AGAM|nr:hypothetical protein FA95DRAFT_1562590 [Auriscalpium vulgare]
MACPGSRTQLTPRSYLAAHTRRRAARAQDMTHARRPATPPRARGEHARRATCAEHALRVYRTGAGVWKDKVRDTMRQLNRTAAVLEPCARPSAVWRWRRWRGRGGVAESRFGYWAVSGGLVACVEHEHTTG